MSGKIVQSQSRYRERRDPALKRSWAMGPGLVCAAGIVWASILAQGGVAPAAESMPPEEQIRETARRVEQVAVALEEAEADERLAAVFRVRSRTVTDLRDQKLDIGEVAVVLALAETGHTSPDAILSLWASGQLDWGEIAERLKVELRDLLRQLEAARRELSRRGR